MSFIGVIKLQGGKELRSLRLASESDVRFWLPRESEFHKGVKKTKVLRSDKEPQAGG